MSRQQPDAYYPISLNVSGRRCVVVGGGQVALRKVLMLLEFGADIEVVSPKLCPELSRLAESGKTKATLRSYQPDDLRHAFITIAATDDSSTNLKVVTDAKREGVLVNVVDDPELSNFIVPSCLRRGKITIAVSTGGVSPALARSIRTRLEKDLGSEYASLAELVGEVRTELKSQDIKVNGDAWQRALDLDWLIELIKRGDRKEAKAVLLGNLQASSG